MKLNSTLQRCLICLHFVYAQTGNVHIYQYGRCGYSEKIILALNCSLQRGLVATISLEASLLFSAAVTDGSLQSQLKPWYNFNPISIPLIFISVTGERELITADLEPEARETLDWSPAKFHTHIHTPGDFGISKDNAIVMRHLLWCNDSVLPWWLCDAIIEDERWWVRTRLISRPKQKTKQSVAI